MRELATRALARGALLDDEGAEGIVYYLATAALTVAEDLQMAEAALAAAVDDARSRGSALGLATASHFQSFAIMRRGRVTAAAAAARAALAGERHGWRLALPSAHVVLAAALAETGDLDGADAQVELAGLHGNTDAASRLAHLAGRADLHLAHRRPQEALADFLACGDLLAAAGAPNPSVLSWRSGAARALAALGDLGEARRLAEEELALARAFGAPGAVGRALRTIGALEIGKPAVEPLEAAVACLEDSQTALERARALVDLGCTLRRAHRSRDAREPLRHGLDLAERCGAVSPGGPRHARGDRGGGAAPAHRPARSRGADSARAADRRARGGGEVEPGDRGRSVRDREDRRMAPQAQLRQARHLVAARAGRRPRTPPPARRSRQPDLRRPERLGARREGKNSVGEREIAWKLLKGSSVAVDIPPKFAATARRTVQ